MTLEEKGPIKPPPVLTKYPQQVSTEIQRWDGIIAATHWEIYDKTKPDGADFYVGSQQSPLRETLLGKELRRGEESIFQGTFIKYLL